MLSPAVIPPVLRTVGGLLVLVFLVPSALAAEVRISEIRTDHPGRDTEEFFELSGPAGMSLDSLTYLVIGDGEGGSGVVESVTRLDGQALGDQGYFLARNHPSPIDGTVAATQLDFSFENADNVTHLLVRGFTGSLGLDLDLDDDGRLDLTPWQEVLDSLALLASDPDLSGDRAYARWRIGPDRGFVPTHVFRDDFGWVMGHFELCDEDTPGRSNATVYAGTARLRSRAISR